MKMPLRKRLLYRLRLKESWVIFFILGMVMMNYPFLEIFSKDEKIFSLPLLYVYLQYGWLISIGVIWLFVKALDMPDEDSDQGEDS